MIIERSMHPDWLSNTYLVADEEGGTAVVIDAGGPSRPLFEAAERLGVDVATCCSRTTTWTTWPRRDVWRERHGVETWRTRSRPSCSSGVDRTIEPGETLEAGGLEIGSLHTPGHTAGMLNFVVDDGDVFTGDTLFQGSVGGVRAPGSTSFAGPQAARSWTC